VEDKGQAAMDRLLDVEPRVTAVFAANDQSAYGARMALYRRNLHVPNDVSLIGLDDLPSSSNCTPPLTTVHQPIFESGLYAAQTLLQMVGSEIPAYQELALANKFLGYMLTYLSMHLSTGMSPMALSPAPVHGQAPQPFVQGTGQPNANEPIAKMHAEKPRQTSRYKEH
jgi:hypothetical protein